MELKWSMFYWGRRVMNQFVYTVGCRSFNALRWQTGGIMMHHNSEDDDDDVLFVWVSHPVMHQSLPRVLQLLYESAETHKHQSVLMRT